MMFSHVDNGYAALPGKLSFAPFGDVAVYAQSDHPSHVILFFSGDGGWNSGVIDMARIAASMDALVLGIDFPKYQKAMAASKAKCAYPAADVENLSKFAQKTLGFTSYIRPVLVGYSSGATLVYALLVEAPPNSYQGVLSLGFCPDLTLGNSTQEPKYALLPELTKPEAYPVLCLAGDEEDDCLCRDHNLTGVKSVMLPGGHHLGGDYDRLVDTLVLGLEKKNDKL